MTPGSRAFARVLLLLAAWTLVPPSVALGQDVQPPANRTPVDGRGAAADVASIDAILAALYGVISGPAGEARDWERMRSLFHPGATFVPTGVGRDGKRSGGVVQDIEAYIRLNGPFFERQGFFETELHREVRQFGHIAQVLSSYRATATPGGPVIARGVNAIQLLFDGTRWWVMSLMWNPEHPTEPLTAPWDGPPAAAPGPARRR